MIHAIAVLGATGFVAGLGLMYASKKFHVVKDPRLAEVTDLLPGANCGGCGLPGCSALADAMVSGKASPTACPVLDGELATKIAGILGVEVGSATPMVAKLKCRGGKDECPETYDYEGPKNCASITMLAGGNKKCMFGCVGGGSCVDACNFDAIHMGESRLPVVDEDACTACGMCAKACPRSLIEITSMDKRFLVTCSSTDKGPDVKKNCTVGCIGCRLCARECPVEAITVENFLAYIDTKTCINCGKCVGVCPTNAIVKL